MSSPSISVPTSPGGTVVLACHHQLLSAGITHTLSSAGWTVTGVGKTFERARELVAGERPDVCLVLVPFPDGAVELIEALMSLPRPPKVICLATEAEFEDSDTVRRVFQAGADGWLTPDISPEVLGRTLSAVQAGEAALSRRHVRLLLSDLRRTSEDHVRLVDGRVVLLSPRQRQVFVAVGQDKATTQIAADLGISTATVRWHVAELLRKLDVAARADLVELSRRVNKD